MPKGPKVVFLDRDAFTVKIEERMIDVPCTWVNFESTPDDLMTERCRDAVAVVTVGNSLERHHLEPLKHLELISACSTGTDHIDTAYCAGRGISVANAVGYATHTVAEHAISLLLALRRNLISYHHDVAQGEWQKSDQFSLPNHDIRELYGNRLGLIGSGGIGRAVGRIAQAFGMEVVIAGRPGESLQPSGRMAFEEVLKTSDVLSIHCPLNDATAGLIGLREFRLMEKKPILINTARGGIVDEVALVAALEQGLISAAGFDVASTEPIAAHNPLLDLVGDPRFILTPHVAWASREAQQAAYNQAVDNVVSFLKAR